MSLEQIRERLKLVDESVHPASVWYARDVPKLLAVVDAAKDFCEACLDRTPAAYEGQPDTVWLQGSANPTGLALLETLDHLTEDR